jgi:hypothetical protein
LPAGVTLSTAGACGGKPTAAGSYTFTVTATDSASPQATGNQQYHLTVNFAITPVPLPSATVGTNYSQTLSGSGGTAPYTNFTVSSGSLPAGLTLTTAGALSGLPTKAGSYTFTVTAADSASTPNAGSQQYRLTVNLGINPSTLTAATVGVSYSQKLTASGGTAPYTFTVASGTSLPAGLALSTAGTLSGKPTAAGSFTFTITAKDSSTTPPPISGSENYTLVVNAPTLVITPTTLPAAHVASRYSQTIHVSGGTAPYTFALASGSSLPAGLTLNSTTGVISGVPTAQTSSPDTFTVQATDASTGTAAPFSKSQSYTLTVGQGLPALVTFLSTLPDLSVNAASPSFKVVVQDALHNKLGGVTVTLRLVTLGAPLPAKFGAKSVIRAVTTADGVASFSGFTVSGRGVFEIDAIADAASGFSNSFVVGLSGRHSPL